MGKQLTKQDIFEIVDKVVSKNNEELLFSINQSFSEIEQKMVTKDYLKAELSRFVTKEELKAQFKSEFAKFETRMVSKDYLDRKLSELRGDLIAEIRHEDKKITATVDLLTVKKIFSREEANKVLAS